jgi:multidrug efflux system membrane fusion protein
MHKYLTIIAASLVLAGCSAKEKKETRATPVGVESVRLHNGELPLRYSANLQPYEQVDLSFRGSGYVDRILQVRGADGRMRAIQDGDRTTRGQVLASLRSTDYYARLQETQAGLADARARLQRAELDFGRSSRLFESQSITKTDFDAAKAAYESGRASMEAARERVNQAGVNLSDTRVVSPLAGTVLKRSITAGTLASPGVPAFTVADTSAMKAIFGVPDVVIARMKPGERLEISTEAFPNEKFEGRITRIGAAADSRSRIFEVEITVPNPGERLRIGMIASLVVSEKKISEPVAVIPISAIVSSQTTGKYSVYVVEQSGNILTARRRDVDLGESFGNDVAVLSGLRAGENIVTVGANLITDGEAIQVVSTAAQLAR